MKKLTILATTFLLQNLLLSCAEDVATPAGNNALPTKEIHYNFETGEKVGEKTLSYNSEGLLVREEFVNEVVAMDVYQIFYEYDSDNNLIKDIKVSTDAFGETTFSNVYTYENGLEKTHHTLLNGKISGYQTEYFYSGNLADSARTYYYYLYEDRYEYSGTEFYDHDASGKLIRSAFRQANPEGLGVTHYTYENDRLVSKCDSHVTFEICTTKDYNFRGQVIRITNISPAYNQLQEELSYVNNRLTEKKIYSYPAYEPGNTTDVKLIRYQYP